ncbi:hypothetical protein [Methylocystis sp. B8]|uniref:hypothetical protein n=1 Tax=Methylocystis sp. B8 TaxID=544938 RepID=UPI001485412A|nr:hypothetical protein [Methylocystis sp. B8]
MALALNNAQGELSPLASLACVFLRDLARGMITFRRTTMRSMVANEAAMTLAASL